jgi:hypothetical protein
MYAPANVEMALTFDMRSNAMISPSIRPRTIAAIVNQIVVTAPRKIYSFVRYEKNPSQLHIR